MKDIFNDVPGQTEEELQQKCVVWFHNSYPLYRGLLFHVPNGGRRTGREGKKFKQMGVIPGVADLILLVNNTAYLLELKDEKGRQSKAQREWQDTVTGNGYVYLVLNSLEKFKREVGEIMAMLV